MSDTIKDSRYLLQKAKDSENFALSKKKKQKRGKRWYRLVKKTEYDKV